MVGISCSESVTGVVETSDCVRRGGGGGGGGGGIASFSSK